ncbi:MAG: trypsin-like peptidase domain-containing protein [Oscillospiraceae bacterium]|nr:trypsin-like peptidase domain-containing protein [Oscillospiraceae bacterium]
MKPEYIKKKGRFQTVIVACLATLIFGGAVGFGGSQLLIEVLKITDSSSSAQKTPSGRSSPKDVDRSNLPDVLQQPDSEYNSGEESGTGVPKTQSGKRKLEFGEEYNAEELYAELSDTVVGIKTASSGNKTFDAVTADIIGSGVVISEEGFIITCAHVVGDAKKVFVVLDDYDDPTAVPHEYEAKVYGSDIPSDLAILKIERNEPFKFAEIGKSDDLRPGQTVVAIGNPVGLIKTMTQGIVSGLQRDLGDNPYMLPSIQTDAALNPGNSGCPLFNMRGEVVGIVNIKLVYDTQIDNLGFAISIDEAMPIISDLTQNGAVTSRPMLGIKGREVVPYFDDVSGFLIESVSPGTPAAESGLSRGDIIIAINGEEVEVAADIQNILKDLSIGDVVTVKVIRYNNFGETNEMEFKFALTSATID